MFQKQGKKLLSAALCVLSLCFSVQYPQAVGTSAAASILMEADSGRILYAQNSDQELGIASTTKIMTALVAIESCALDEVVEIKQSHMVEGSSMYLKPGEELTLETLLYGLMLCSGNDAALAVADHCGPGVDAFVARMNEKAGELGLAHTSFANPNGLDAEGHYSTARDMAVLAAYAMQNETFARIVSTKRITIGGRTMVHHNKLLSQYEGCIGLKTGYTKSSGRTLVSCAVQDGMKLIVVTLKDGNDWADHAALYDYGFGAYQLNAPAAAGETAAQIPVIGGTAGTVALQFSGDFSYPVASGETLTMRLDVPESVFAPVSAGQEAGEAVFLLNEQEVGRVKVCYGETVPALLRQNGGVGGIFRKVLQLLNQ